MPAILLNSGNASKATFLRSETSLACRKPKPSRTYGVATMLKLIRIEAETVLRISLPAIVSLVLD
ncbi:hypothetical protein [Bradyrhizobium sp. USDA 4504]